MASAGYNAAAIGFRPTLDEMRARGKAFWGDIEEGTQVNTQKAQRVAQDRYLDTLSAYPNSVPVLPVIDLVDPDDVRKAIFAPGDSGIERLNNQIAKAIDALQDEVTEIIKATTTSSNLIHSVSDTDVALLFRKIYPTQTLISTEVNRGKIAQWDAVPPNGAGTAFYGPEDPVLTESDMRDHTRYSECKILYAYGRVTKMAREAGKSQVPARDLMAIRAMAMAEMLKNLRERGVLGVTRDVTVTNTVFTPAGPYEHPGLYEMVTKNTADPNWIDVSGKTVSNKDQIQDELNKSYTRMVQDGLVPNLALCDYGTFHAYRKGLNEFFRTESVKTVDYGVAKINLIFPAGEVPMVPVPFLPSAPGKNGVIKLLDVNFVARRSLWPEMFEELANLNTASRGVVTAAETLIDKTDVDGQSSLQGGVVGITLA